MCTSTPPVHARPSARRSRPRGCSARTCSIAAIRPSNTRVVEEVQRRLVDRQDGERPVLLERPGTQVGHTRSSSAVSLISSMSPSAGDPRQLQRVVVVARDDVDVEVEDGLPRRRAARVQEVDAVGAERLLRPVREALRAAHARVEVLRGIDSRSVGARAG